MVLSKLAPYKDIIYTDFQGNGGILVDLNTKQYYQLNETGSLVWRGLENGNTLEDIVSQMRAIYEVTEEHAEASVQKLVSHLESRRLIQRT